MVVQTTEEPFTRTLSAPATSYTLFTDASEVWGTSAELVLTSLGGGSYVNVGTRKAQVFPLTTVGDYRKIESDIQGEVINLNETRLLTDGVNATVAVVARLI